MAEAFSEARLDLSKLDGDIRKVERKLAQATKRMESKLKLRVDIDTRLAEQKLRTFERNVSRTRQRINARGISLDVDVEANAAAAAEAGRAAREAAESAFGDRPITVTVDLNDRRFRAAYRRIQTLLTRLASKRYKVTVDLDYDETGFAKLRDTVVRANEARRLKIDAEFDVDLESARAEVRRAREELRLLTESVGATAGSAVSITVELDGASRVLSELAAIQTALAALPRQVSVDVDTRGGVDALTRGGVTNSISELIAGLEEAGVSIGSFLESFDAAQGVLGRLLPSSVREQLIEAARAANGTILAETRNSINKTQEQLKAVTEKVGPLFQSDGAKDAIAKASEVAAAVNAVPDEVTVRYRTNAADFFDDSFAEEAAARASAASAAAATASERINNEQLRETRARAQQAVDEYARLLVDGEKEAQRLRQESVLAFDDETRQRELASEAKKLDAKLDRWRKYAAEAKAIATQLAAELERSDEQLRNRLRSERIEDRQLRVTTFFEGLARTLAEIGSINRPLDDIERPRTADIDVDTAALDALLADLAARLGALDRDRIEVDFGADADSMIEMIELSQQLLDGVDGRRVVAEFDVDGLLTSATELEVILAQLEGLATGQPITAEVEAVLRGLPGALSGLAELRAAAELSDTTVEVDVDTTSVPGAIRRILTGFAPLRRLLGDRSAGQTGAFDLSALFDGLRSLPAVAAAAAQRVRPLLRRAIDLGETAAVEVRYKGLPRFLRDSAAILAQKRLIDRDIDIDVDLDRPGLLTRGFGGLARGAGRLVASIGTALSAAAGLLSKFGDAVSDSLSDAGEKLAGLGGTIAEGLGKAVGAISSAAGPIGSAIATVVGLFAGPTLIGLLVGAVTALAGPLIAALGGLIGGAVAFLGSSVVAGLAVGGLPIAAVLLGPAKEEIGRIIGPLKDQLVTAFEPTTDLIVNSIVPAFAQIASEIIPVAASVADSFITPIAESLYALAANPALKDAIVSLAAPMGAGIASVIDTFTQFVPLFTDIALQIGPPIIDAVNSILRVVLTLGSVFAGDIAGGFRVIAELFDRIRPALASFGPILTPVLNLLAQLVTAFVDAGAAIEERTGGIGQYIDDIAAAIPDIVPGLVALGEAFIAILDYLPELVRGFRAFAALVTIALATVAGAAWLLLKAFGLVVKGIAGLNDRFILQPLQLVIAGLATVAEALNLPFADKLRGAEQAVGGLRDMVAKVGNVAFNAGDGAYGMLKQFGNATVTALGYGDAMGSVADATGRGAESIAQLEAKARQGQISMVDFADATGQSATSGVRTLGKAVDGLTKRLEDGSFALGNFTADALELPTAADFVTEVADPQQAARDQRDQQRRLRDLQRQTQRDQEDIARAAQDYQTAIREAAEVRQEAPEKYEWGANNFNAVLFADSVKRQEEYDKQLQDTERAIQDRARALEDAQLRQGDNQAALADALSDQALGDPSSITTKVIDINQALTQGFAQIQATADRARTLLQIRNLGADFDPLADFLETLDPDLLKSAIDQWGGVGSEAFADAARRMNEKVDESNTGFEQRMQKKRELIAAESLRIQRLMDLVGFGFEDLAAELGSIEDIGEFNAEFEGIKAGIGFSAAEAQVDAANQMQEDLKRRAELAREYGFKLVEASVTGQREGVAEGLARYTGGVTTSDGKRFGSIDSAVVNSQGLSSSDLGGQAGTEAGSKGVAIGTEIISGVVDALDDGSGKLQEATSALLDSLDPEEFTARGAASAAAFYDGLESGFQNDVNRAFALGALGGLEISLRSRTAEYEVIGDAWGGAVIAGIVNGVNADAGTLAPAFDLLSGSISTDSITETWAAAGDTLGRAVMGGIEAGIADSREFLSGRLGAVRLGVTLQADLWAEAGDTLGAAVVAGVASGIEADWQTVLTALGLYAADVGRQTRPWVDAGNLLGGALTAGVAQGVLGSRDIVALSVAAALADPSLSQVALTQGELIGRALGAGLIRGIALAAPDVLRVAAALAVAVATTMRVIMGINSPSKVTTTIGQQVTQGLVAGIESGRSAVLASASTLATALTDVLAETAEAPSPLDGWLTGGDAVASTAESLRMLEAEVVRRREVSAIGTGVGALLTGQVAAANTQAVYNQQSVKSESTNNRVVENVTYNLYGSDPVETVEEIAMRQRTRRYLNQGGRRR